eukprot:5489091-Pyramimonas_sp.AAC.1
MQFHTVPERDVCFGEPRSQGRRHSILSHSRGCPHREDGEVHFPVPLWVRYNRRTRLRLCQAELFFQMR